MIQITPAFPSASLEFEKHCENGQCWKTAGLLAPETWQLQLLIQHEQNADPGSLVIQSVT
jgi:hypothetical protein